jgi:3',5'-cyclic AMP phosphodiesterase CpdA
MRLMHMSDFHFGTEIPDLLEDLYAHVKNISADLVIASGDFTQIGSNREFAKAREFLEALGKPFLAVPGNHDIPRFDLVDRFTDPYQRYRAHITENLLPVHKQDNVCIAGINTARRILPHWNWAHGAVSPAQLSHLKTVYDSVPSSIKICVMHHPAHKAENNPLKTIVYGGGRALKAFQDLKVDLVLTGHVHHASITTIEEEGHKVIYLSASTALSRRLRGEETNGFNIIELGGDEISIEIHSYIERQFRQREKFKHKKL